jgi:hypothetical protein
MMVNYLLCKSELFQNTATAVVDMLGGVGESFMGSCSPKRHLPHLILHGMVDPIITYDRDNIVDGSNFISTSKWRLTLADFAPPFSFCSFLKEFQQMLPPPQQYAIALSRYACGICCVHLL